jgi:hypothetical protein
LLQLLKEGRHMSSWGISVSLGGVLEVDNCSSTLDRVYIIEFSSC